MKWFSSPVFGILLFATTALSCSFDYRDEALTGEDAPEMVLREARASRYEKAVQSVVFTARTLEIYDADRIWAAETVRFTEYDDGGDRTVALEGSAQLLLINEKESVYSLGGGTEFFIRDDGLRVVASDLQWQTKLHRLYGPENGTVELIRDDGSSVRGTGFFADTLSRSYLFKRNFSGVITSDFSGETTGEEQ